MTIHMYNGKKCIVCGWFVIGTGVNPPNPHAIASKMVEPVCKWNEHDEYMTKQCEPIYCELCLIGLMGNGLEYVWNGVELLVFNGNDGEYHEPTTKTYNPIANNQISFKYIKRRGKWMATIK